MQITLLVRGTWWFGQKISRMSRYFGVPNLAARCDRTRVRGKRGTVANRPIGLFPPPAIVENKSGACHPS